MKQFHARSLLLLVLVGYCCVGSHAADPDEIYVSWHRNWGVGGKFDTLFTPTNDVEYKFPSSAKPSSSLLPQPPFAQDEDFMSGLQALKDIVDKAAADEARLRPYGSRWSFNDIPYTDEYMIDTYGLNYAKIGIENDTFVTSEYNATKELLTFCQGGLLVKHLYKALFDEGLTLSTSAVTDGQTMAGSISTGTHNAALVYGSMEEMVKGIHLVLPSRTVFLQKEMDQVVTEDYMDAIGADELISNDELFLAALVSCGTFGIVHGYLIETEVLFELEVDTKKDMSFSQASEALYTLDFESLGFDLDEEPPWHFEFYLNPYQLELPGGCQIRVMQKVAISDERLEGIKNSIAASSYTPTYLGKYGTVLMSELVNERLLDIIDQVTGYGFIGASITRFLYGIYSQIANAALINYGGYEGKGYPLELYGDPLATSYYDTNPLSSISMELSLPLGDLDEILPLVLGVLRKYPSITTISARYVKSSSTIPLALAKFDDITVFIDLPSLDTVETRLTFRKIQEALEERRDELSFTYHWGKFNPDNDEWVEASYGQTVLDNWKNEREAFLETPETLRLFSNEFTDSLGLT